MTKVKFEVEIDISNASHTEALSSFLKVLGGQGVQGSPVVKQKPQEEEKPLKKTRKTKVAPEKENPEQTDEQRLVAIRALLSKTIQEGGDEARDKCVAKLEEMGAKNPDTGKYNISSLDPSKYDGFAEFLNSI